MTNKLTYYLKATLNSYAILFFSQNRILGGLVLLASMLNITAGITGLFCVVFTLYIVKQLGYNQEIANTGVYSFNALILGLGFGTFFSFGYAYWLWLILACLLCIILSVSLITYFGKRGLPVLSIPFILVFWLVIIATNGYAGMGLMQKNSYMVFEIYSGSAVHLNSINDFLQANLPPAVSLFFRSLSAVIFQNSLIAGILIGIGVLIHSRIAFSLLILGLISAYALNHFTGTYPYGLSNYHLGANFMMASLAMGGFFLIPSARSYLLAIISVGFMFLMVNGLTRILDNYNLPIFSMPFSLLTITLLYFFMQRTKVRQIHITPFQNYSPETNLYQFINDKSRLKSFQYINIQLPFMGAWRVSQAYNGSITHVGDWAQALDFVITDSEQKTFEFPGKTVTDYYCYNKPVLACADGTVAEVVQHIDDNEIGKVNLAQNWGNTIIIKHVEGLYSKVSHLKKNSSKVKQGDEVKQGDVIALCGNSGRSPEPHLHFQLQVTPYIGAKTLAYPLANYLKIDGNKSNLHCSTVPQIGDLVQKPDIHVSLKQAFNFEPGYVISVTSDKGQTETWEVFKDCYQHHYLYCIENQAVAYFYKNSHSFLFTKYYGQQQTLLWHFFKAAYHINFSGYAAHDTYAINSKKFKCLLWLQDFISPFYIFLRYGYSNQLTSTENSQTITAIATQTVANNTKEITTVKLLIVGNELNSFEVEGKKYQVKCDIKSI